MSLKFLNNPEAQRELNISQYLCPIIKTDGKQSIFPYLVQGPEHEIFLEDYNKIVDKQFQGNKYLKKFEIKEANGIKKLTGSSPLMLPIAQLVSKRRLIRPEELQITLNDGDYIGIKGKYYVDLGIFLDFSKKNHEMAIDLFNQLPKDIRNINNLPYMILNYSLKNFNKGNYGLNFKIHQETIIRPAPILASKNGNFSNKDVSLENGLPHSLGKGNRTLYINSQLENSLDNLGVTGVCVGSSLDIYSFRGGLDDSFSVGRVVFV